MSRVFILFEHAAGYCLFKVLQFEEIGSSGLVPQVEQNVCDLTRFSKVVTLHAHKTFETAVEALDAINCISEGIVPESLQVFLESHFPKASKNSKYTIGVTEPKLGANISELLGFTCVHSGIVPEITRGIRLHFSSFMHDLTKNSSTVAQLGLGHSYSRAKVKFNVNFVDNMIIQSIALLDQLDKDINVFSMRMREWYSYHFPELYKIVPDNYLYAKTSKFVGNRKELSEDHLEELEEIVMDSAKPKAILDAARSSMGMDISPLDLMNVQTFATRVIELANYRTELLDYLKHKMSTIAPNLSSLLGEQVGARLISHAGSLTNLAKCPASTVQILGAEKALFRALKTRGKTPKYGILYNSTFIGKAGLQNKGRISRFLANKCSIASRIDCFADVPSNIFGEKLRSQVEERLLFYESGNIPSKNKDVMSEACIEYLDYKNKIERKERKKKKKSLEANTDQIAAVDAVEEVESTKQKKKKRKTIDNLDPIAIADEVEVEESTKQKKRKTIDNADINGNAVDDMFDQPQSEKKKKKKKLVQNGEELGEVLNSFVQNEEEQNIEDYNEEQQIKKKKKKNKNKSL